MPTILSPFVAPPVPEPTAADVLAKEIMALANAVAPFLVSTHQQIYQKLWDRSIELGVTPQEVLDSVHIGVNAGALFQRGGELVNFLLTTGIAQMDPAEYAPRQVPTFNQDGTVLLSID